MIVSLENVPKNLENLRKTWNLKMRISTKSFYKLFSVVHNYFLWMFLIIERKYVDRIPPKCPKKLRKIAKKGKPENANIYWTILQTFQCGSQLLSMNVSIHWEDIWWSYLSKMYPKTEKLRKRKTWKCQYLLNHSINFSVCSQKLSMNVSNHWEDIWWSYPSKMSPKT